MLFPCLAGLLHSGHILQGFPTAPWPPSTLQLGDTWGDWVTTLTLLSENVSSQPRSAQDTSGRASNIV